MVAVLDASAVLALILKEPGGAKVVDYLGGGCMSVANYAEVIHTLGRIGVEVAVACDLIEVLRIEIVPLTADIAAAAAELANVGSSYGLSLGDRACLATAGELGVAAVTADRVWSDLDLDVDVIAIR